MARERLLETKKLLASGRDPAVQAKLARITRAIAAANTFGLVADEYLRKYEREGRAEATVLKARWLIDFARSDIGQRPIGEVMPMEVLQVLRKVESRGRLDTARRLRSTIRMGYSKDEMTSHGFRATAATLLNESGHWNPDAVERQLAHIEQRDVRRAYARGQYWDERVRWRIGELTILIA